MAVLTWRNVDAPNRSDTVQALGLAGRLLGDAPGNLADALGKFGNWQTEQNNNLVQQNALQYQDPASLKAALANGSILAGTDPSKVSVGTLSGLQGKVGDLLTQASNQQTLDTNTYNQNRAVQGNQLADAAQPTVNKLLAASATGDPAKIAAAQAEAGQDPAYQALRSSQVNNVLKDSQDLSGKQTQNSQSQFNLTIGQRNDADSQAGLATGQLIAAGGYDNQGALEQVNRLPTPGQRAAAMAYLQGKGYAFNQGPLDGGGAGGTGSPSGSPSALGVTLGGGQLDPSIKTVGDVINNKQKIIDQNKGHSNVGLYQITADTFNQFAPQALGANWQNADVRSFDTQDKVGKAIWDSVKSDPSAMKGRWTSLSDAQAQQLQGADWNQAREVIAKGESSTSPAAIQAQLQQNQVENTILTGGAQSRNAQDIANLGLDPKKWVSATNRTENSPADEASQLVEGNGPLKSQNVSWVQNHIDAIMRQSAQPDPKTGKPVAKLNAAQAGVILESAIAGGSNSTFGRGLDSIGNFFSGNGLSTGQELDQNKINQLVKNTATGSPIDQAGKTLANQQTQQNISGAAQAYQVASAKYGNMVNALRLGRPVDKDTEARITAEYKQADAMLKLAQASAQGNADQKPIGWKAAADAQQQQADDEEARKRAISAAFDQSLNNPWSPPM
jgi:hypothetical protein